MVGIFTNPSNYSDLFDLVNKHSPLWLKTKQQKDMLDDSKLKNYNINQSFYSMTYSCLMFWELVWILTLVSKIWMK